MVSGSNQASQQPEQVTQYPYPFTDLRAVRSKQQPRNYVQQ